MFDRWEVKDNQGRTFGYAQRAGPDADAVGALLAMLLGFGILYVVFAGLAAIWNAGRGARIVLLGGIAALAVSSMASNDPALMDGLVSNGRRYVAWASGVPLSPFPNLNLTVVSMGLLAATYLAVVLLWKPTMGLVGVGLTAVFAMAGITLMWTFWLALGQAIAIGLRLAAHWLFSGAVGNGLDWLQVTPVCFLLPLPLILRRKAHLRSVAGLIQAGLIVTLIGVSPWLGAWLVDRLGFTLAVQQLISSLDQASAGGSIVMAPAGAAWLSVMTVAGGPVAGLLLTAIALTKRLMGAFVTVTVS